jgi:hypothetical protein
MPESEPDPQKTPVPVDAEIVDAEIVEPTALTPPPPAVSTDYTDQGVPTLDYVRDKIEGRSATATGWEELRTEETRKAEEQFAEREEKGKAKLEELRKQLGL